jgi:hypothetical protein
VTDARKDVDASVSRLVMLAFKQVIAVTSLLD